MSERHIFIITAFERAPNRLDDRLGRLAGEEDVTAESGEEWVLADETKVAERLR